MLFEFIAIEGYIVGWAEAVEVGALDEIDEDAVGDLVEELDVGLTRIVVLVGDGEAVLGITVVGTVLLVNVETMLVGTELVIVELALEETGFTIVELALEETGFTIVELALEETGLKVETVLLVKVETTLVGTEVLAVILDEEEDETTVGIARAAQLESVVEATPVTFATS